MSLFADYLKVSSDAKTFEVIDPHEFIRAAFACEQASVIRRPPGFNEGYFVHLDLATVFDFSLVASDLARQTLDALEKPSAVYGQEAHIWQSMLWRWWIGELCEKPKSALLLDKSKPAKTESWQARLLNARIHLEEIDASPGKGDSDNSNQPASSHRNALMELKATFGQLLQKASKPFNSEAFGLPIVPEELRTWLKGVLLSGEGSSTFLSVCRESSKTTKLDKPPIVLCVEGMSQVPSEMRAHVLQQLEGLRSAMNAHLATNFFLLVITPQRCVNSAKFPVVHFPRLPENSRWLALPLFLVAMKDNRPHAVLHALEEDIDAIRIMPLASSSLCQMLLMGRRVLEVAKQLITNTEENRAVTENEKAAANQEISLSFQIGNSKQITLLLKPGTKEPTSDAIKNAKTLEELYRIGLRIEAMPDTAPAGDQAKWRSELYEKLTELLAKLKIEDESKQASGVASQSN